MQNGTGQTNNPFIDLADTTVVVGEYNPVGNLDTPLLSATTGDETVNTTNFTVDRYGRLTYAQTSAIATAKQGSLDPVFDNATAYSRYDKVKNSTDKLYEAIADVSVLVAVNQPMQILLILMGGDILVVLSTSKGYCIF